MPELTFECWVVGLKVDESSGVCRAGVKTECACSANVSKSRVFSATSIRKTAQTEPKFKNGKDELDFYSASKLLS